MRLHRWRESQVEIRGPRKVVVVLEPGRKGGGLFISSVCTYSSDRTGHASRGQMAGRLRVCSPLFVDMRRFVSCWLAIS